MISAHATRDPIRPEDLQILAQVSQALWLDPTQSRRASVETLSAVALQDLTADRALERAAAALLDRAAESGAAGNFRETLAAGASSLPFYRLPAPDRFLLVALHWGRWSYERLARVMGSSVLDVETRAWRARLALASMLPQIPYPSGAPARGPHCPEYQSARPWTQRFLDDELTGGRERVFFQNHLMACSSCRDALSRCREAYYAIDAAMPRVSMPGDIGHELAQVTRQGWGLRTPADRSFGETLEIFAQRRDVRIALGLLGGLVAYRLLF